jgi:glycine betaine catabolism A
MLSRIRAQCATGQADWLADDRPEASIPVERYTSTLVWQAELAQLFRPLPLIAAHSSELQAGQVLAHDSYGLPILLSRDAAGTLYAHLNVCRHRGMRLVPASSAAHPKASIVCPYHGWTYQLSGEQRHRLHADTFDTKPCAQENLVPLPCAERHGLIWVVPDPQGSIDLDGFLGGLSDELPFYEIEQLQHFRTIEATYPANWKLIVDAFLESYHLRVLHKNTIYPFFTDGITASQSFGEHIHSLVARRSALDWAKQAGAANPSNIYDLSQITTPSAVIFPNTVAIFHPDYLSLITLYPLAADQFRWTHRMLIPKNKAGADWAAHWEKTFHLIEQQVFQQEDIATAVAIQQGFASGANTHLRVGRIELGLATFHASVKARTQISP